MDLDERLLPQEIKQLEKGPKWKRPYSTHMVGKWHLGNCDKKFLPHNRGFDSFYGIYGGAVNYYNKTKKLGGVPFVDYFDREEPVRNWSEKNLPKIQYRQYLTVCQISSFHIFQHREFFNP